MTAFDRLSLLRFHPALLAAAIGVLTLVTFAATVSCDFVNFDDGPYVYENPLVLGGLTLTGIRRAWTEVMFGFWSPLTIMSLQLDATLFGTKPWGFHLTNLVLHAVASALLFMAWFRMTAAPGLSAAAMLLFAIHPLRVESVAWIAERKDVLSVLFLSLSLLAYERYSRMPSRARYLVVAPTLLGSLLCKATLVTLPVLLLLLDVWPLGRCRLPGVAAPQRGDGSPSPYPIASWQTLVLEKLPLLALAGVFVPITIATQQEAIQSSLEMPLWQARVPNAMLAVLKYLAMTVWPGSLMPCYIHRGMAVATPPLVLGGIVGVVCLSGLAWWSRGRFPAVAVGIAWFLISLTSVLGVVRQHGFQSHADRFTYVPHVGLSVAIVWGFAALADWLRTPRTATLALAATVAVAYAVVDQRQIGFWRNSEALWNRVLAVDPANYMAHTKVGTQAYENKDLHTAKSHLLLAMQSSNGAWFVIPKLAVVCFDLGDTQEARRLRDRALAIAPDTEHTRWMMKQIRRGLPENVSPEAQRLVATGLKEAREARMASALEIFGEAVALEPTYAAAHNNVGMALSRLDRQEEAVAAFQRAVAANPYNADYRLNLAEALVAMGKMSEAAEQVDAALDNDPTDSTALRLRSRLSAPGDKSAAHSHQD